jgi:GntR family transcriptional regulator, transcriptional repressor for pyruvate dehydrogenase complex
VLWGIRPVEPQATFGLAVDRLRRQIHAGLLLPGEKLPAERQLSENFGISRVTLREALRVLETASYIGVRRGANGGAFVTDAKRLAELSHRRFAREPGQSMRMLEFLCVVENAACDLATARRALPEQKRMRQAMGLIEESLTAPHLKQAEAYFHLALGDASHNMMLSRSVEDALADLFIPYADTCFAEAKAASECQHRALMEAVDGKDPEGARRAMGAVHDGYWSRLREMMRSAA